MIRNLLATTAIATLVATGAYAQTTEPQTDTMGAEQQQNTVHADGHLASNIMGESVFNGAQEDAENIGNINDVILADDGSVEGIVIGVGGFLGLGQKNVAVEYAALEWAERDGERYLVLEASREQLEELPEFDVAAYEPQPADAEVGSTEIASADQLGVEPQSDTAAADEDAAAETDEDMAASDEDAAAETDEDMAAADEDAAAETDEDMAASDEDAAAETDEDMAATDEDAAAETDEDMAAAEETEDTDTTVTGAIDRESLTDVDAATISADDFIGTTVYGANDDNVGSIDDVIVSGEGEVDAVIVDVGGFLGIGSKEVALGLDNLAFLSDEDGNYYLYTEFTQDQLEQQPEYDSETFAERRDDQLLVQ